VRIDRQAAGHEKMRQNADNEEVMMNYLLGDLSEEEQLRLEERFFTDDECYQQMLALEDELIYDYAAGGLASEQRLKFERRFLTSPEARHKVEAARAALGKAAETRARRLPNRAPSPAPNQALSTEERKSLWQSLLGFVSFQRPSLRFSLAAVSALLLVCASWLIYQTLRLRSQVEQPEAARAGREQQAAPQPDTEGERRKRAQLEEELANQQTRTAPTAPTALTTPTTPTTPDRKSEPPASSTIFSFARSPGLVRGDSGPKRITAPAGAVSLRLRLLLTRPDNYRGYHATLQTLEGTELWQVDTPRAGSTASGRSVIITLPAQLALRGDYVIILKGRTETGEMEEIDEYYFSVMRR
jgi:anti-sigma factor RsiW